jgi:hypothetical protein
MELAALKSNLEPLQFPDPAERPLQPERKDGSVSQGEERLLKPREVADRFGVSERWVRDHATRRSPRIPSGQAWAFASVPSGGRRRISLFSAARHLFQKSAGRCMNETVLRDQRWTR